MSLIHHWPLVDGLKDNLGRVSLTGDSTVAIGKIGPCREVDGQFLQASDSKLKELDIFSISMWVKYSSAKAAWTDIFGLQITNGVTSASLRLEITSVEGNKAGVFNNGVLTTSSGAGTYMTLEKEKWHHIVLTKDNSTIQYFLDGVLIQQHNFLNTEGCTNGWGTGEFHIGDDKKNYKGRFSDVRIYDHVLSQAEISELAKALAVHYTFDDVLAEPTINIDSCKNAMKIHSLTGLSPGATTVTFGNYYGYECFEMYLKQEEFTKWIGCYLNINPLSYGAKIGDTVTRSMWLYVPSGQTTPKHFTESIEGNSSGKSYVNYDFNKCDTWQRVSLTGTITDDKTNHFLHYFMASNVGDPAVDFKCYIRDFQMEIKDHTTWYTSNERKNNLFNEAGYVQPDTTETKNVSIIAEPAVGSRALRCNETVIVTPLVADIDQGVTISCWVKTPEYPTTNQVVFADTNSKIAFGFFGTDAAIVSCARKSEKIISNFKGLWEEKGATEWQHLVITRNAGGTLTCWLNGKKIDQSAETSTNNWSQDKEALIIGCRYNGSYGTYCSCYVDDFRVYQTLLSDDDIIDLYKTKGYISKQGDIMCNEFIENCEAALITKNGTFEVNEMQEELYASIYSTQNISARELIEI